MTTINQAILDTLRTDAAKEPKHREMLESLGYKLGHDDPCCSTWEVDGYHIRRYGKWEARLGGGRLYEGLDALKRIDWADFLAKRGERGAKRLDMNKREGIWEDRRRTFALGWGGPTTYLAGNGTVERFKELRKRQDTCLEERSVEHARKRLEEAQRDYERAVERLAEAQAQARDATEEIAAMLAREVA